MTKDSFFQNFTNQYALTKTLRFELKPVGETKKMLEDAKVFEKDETIQKKYEATKPYSDRLHREFVDEALSGVSFSGLTDYFQALQEWQKDKKNKDIRKAYDKQTLKLRKQVVEKFDAQAKKWATEQYTTIGLKNTNIEILFEEAVFDLLKARYGHKPEAILRLQKKDKKGKEILDENGNPEMEEVSIFESWKGFTGYFGKFFETRKNFYKDDGTSTALATRIIDQNLKRFCDNILIFQNVKEKVDFSEVEKTFGISLSEIFSLEFYNSCLLQDGIDFYNKILGGETKENGEKLRGVNELINEYRQKNKEDKIKFLVLLDKQILSEKEKIIGEINDEKGLLENLKNFYVSAEQKTKLVKDLFTDFVNHQEKYNLSQVYIEKKVFDPNSCKYLDKDSLNLFQNSLYEGLKKAKIVSGSAKKKDGEYSFPDFIALSFIKDALESSVAEKIWKEKYYKDEDNSSKGFLDLTNQANIWKQFLAIFQFEFVSLFEKEVINQETGAKSKIGYEPFKQEIEKLLQNFIVNPDSKVTIKNYADAVLTIYQMAKYFAVEKKRAWQTDYELDTFYTDPEKGYLRFYDNAYKEIVQVYNDLRNYLTKKPYSEDKWKLNFENPALADGWDKNKESDNSAVVLRKNGKYFLGIMAKENNKIFDFQNSTKFSEGIESGKYEKMVYKQMADPKRDFPKGVFSAKGLSIYKPSEEVLSIYERKDFKTEAENFSKIDLWKLIDFFKNCIPKHPSWKLYDFTFSPTQKYNNLNDFYKEVSENAYKISFQDISESYINEKNEKGELYLFQIVNKDFELDKRIAPEKYVFKGGKTKNLHTLYFESLFSAENIAKNFPIKLNGQAEIFYRPKTKDITKEKITTQNGKTLEKGERASQKNRFTEDKIFFHVPLTLNRTKNKPNQFNAKINNFLANNPEINVIGVDRGEKHLAYFSVITQKGEILERGSLNEIAGVNYAEKLEAKAKNREQAHKDWQAVEGIKDLKKGYISQVVRKLADLAIKHNAIIVLEDLNMRFKQIRGGIEKSIYQQLEKALIEKLSFLVEKGETDPEKAGHLLRAYQLTAPVIAFKDMGKQTGILFYTQAAYTSRIDPVTGWRPHLYLKYSNAEKAKADILKFSRIAFANERFEFTYDIEKFQPKNKEHAENTVWTVCSNVSRFRWDRSLNQNKRGYTHYEDITKNLQELFEAKGIDVTQDIKDQISRIDEKDKKNSSFFRDLIYFFNLICQIRNTDEKASSIDKKDFILSPVDPFFDSRNPEKFGKNLPQNGDDNGAYNIARKGIVILKKISAFYEANQGCEKMGWGDLYISNTDWDNFAKKNPVKDARRTMS